MPYTYLWNNGTTDPSIHNAVPGYYTVTVTDANGCTDSTGGLLQGFLNNPVATIDFTVSPGCFGSNNGMLQAGVSGGIPPYTYVWNTGATTASLNGIPSATYTVTVTDSVGCTSTVTTVLAGPSGPLNGVIQQIHPVSCYGYQDGSAVIGATGGTAPYQYLWNTGVTGSNLNNLVAGSYTVTIMDANGCTTQMPVTISQPGTPLLAMTVVSSPIGCHGDSTGMADLTVQGGTAPYTYQWSNGISLEDPTALTAGYYQVTVTDAAGCLAIASITLQEPDPIDIAAQLQHVTCFGGSDGSVHLQVQGGIPPFTFNWGQGNTSGTLQGMVAGIYSVVVIDAAGCTVSQQYEISQPSLPLTASVTTIQPACNGAATGTVAIVPSGGTHPYSILWSNGSSSDTLDHLAPGTYHALITDLNGCTFIVNTEVTVDSAFLNMATQLLQPVSCHDASDASAGVLVSGGVSPYTFNWSSGQTSPVINGLSSGLYTVSVTDANGCQGIANLTVPAAPPAIDLAVATTPAQCLSGLPGSAQVMIQGGTAPYEILWSNGVTTAQVNGLNAGLFTATITDANGCVSHTTANITDESILELKTNGPQTICSGETAALVCDSFPGYSYQWYYQGQPLSGVTSTSFNTPAAGYYQVSISGTCGTFYSDSLLITVRTMGDVSITSDQIICPPETAQLLATGGTAYEWNPASFITFAHVPDPVVSPLQTTTYQVTITDHHGCRAILSTTVSVVCDSLLVPTGFSPDGDGTNDGFVISGIENYPGNKLWVYNRWGRLVFKTRGYKNDWNGTGNVSGIFMNRKLNPGTYYYILDLGYSEKPRSGYLIIRY
jgi:gliding motility-associated-like protein